MKWRAEKRKLRESVAGERRGRVSREKAALRKRAIEWVRAGRGVVEANRVPVRLTVMVTVTVMSRKTCGSCARVISQIEPLVRSRKAQFQVEDVDADPDVAMEFGDRVPVILVNDEEIACWEIDDDELIEAIAEAE